MKNRNRFSIKILAFLFILAFSFSAQAQIGKVQPVDEAIKDPSFFVFRARLFDIIQRRNVADLVGVLDPNIKAGFGGNDGVQNFKKNWTLDKPTSKLWSTLSKAIALGGSFDGTSLFSAPYSYSKFPENADAFENGVIIGENVRVRQDLTASSPILTQLSYDIVKVTDWKPKVRNKQNWISVTLSNGKKGYVAEDYIVSPVGYRAIFEKKNGQWRMTAFVAGD